jgi:phosphoribosylformylglycinamidine (FGAM) synthase-like enzyme
LKKNLNCSNHKQLIQSKLLQSAHDISEGGLITALLESGFNRQLGFDVQQSANNVEEMLIGLAKDKAG